MKLASGKSPPTEDSPLWPIYLSVDWGELALAAAKRGERIILQDNIGNLRHLVDACIEAAEPMEKPSRRVVSCVKWGKNALSWCDEERPVDLRKHQRDFKCLLDLAKKELETRLS